MKKLSLLLCSVAVTISTFSQHLSPGFLFGMNLSSLGNDNSYRMKMKAGVHGGLVLPVQLKPRFVLQTELLYSNQGAEYRTNNGAKHLLNLNYISIPLQAQYLISKRLLMQTGPQISFLIAVKDKVAGSETGFFTSQDFKTIDFSWTAGVKYLWHSKLGIVARYNFSIDKMNNGGLNEYKNKVLQLGFFYVLKTHPKNR